MTANSQSLTQSMWFGSSSNGIHAKPSRKANQTRYWSWPSRLRLPTMRRTLNFLDADYCINEDPVPLVAKGYIQSCELMALLVIKIINKVMMDIRNKNSRRVILAMLEKAVKSIMSEPSNSKARLLQEQQARLQQYEVTKRLKQDLNNAKPSPAPARAHSKSDHDQFYQRSQSQLETRNEKLQKTKEEIIQKKLEAEIKEATFQPQLITRQRSTLKPKTGADLYQSGLQWMQNKVSPPQQNRQANNIENLKESAEIIKNFDINFKPQLNRASVKILKETNQLNFFQRLDRSEKKRLDNLNKLKRDATPSFKPQINKSAAKLQSSLSKDVVRVNVDLGLLEKIRTYNFVQRDATKENQLRAHTHHSIKELSQSLDLKNSALAQDARPISLVTEHGNDGPSFRVNASTIKKQPRLQMDPPGSESGDLAEMMYEAIQDEKLHDYFHSELYE